MLERLPEPSVARRRACQPPSWTARGMPCPFSDAGCTLRPTHRFSVSRSSVTPLGGPSTAQSDQVPPAGLEPAPSGLRARRHRRFDHGARGSGGRIRTCPSRLTVARLTDSTTPERGGGSRNRTCEAGTALRLSRALPFQLGHASVSGRRGSRTPKARRPTRFRDGVPRQWPSFQSGPGRGRTCTHPIKSRGLSLLSYGAQECGRQGSNLRRPAFQAGALPAELRPHDGRGWSRTSGLLFVRQALSPSELLARGRLCMLQPVGEAGVEPAASSLSEKRSSS